MKEFKNIKVGYLPNTEVLINNKKYLIHGVCDGEDIIVDEKTKKYPFLSEVKKKNPNRIDDGCPFQNICGGCQFMHISYEYEKELKTKFLNDLFKSFKMNVNLISTEKYLNYRNKIQMTYKTSNKGKVTCGFYEEYSHNLVSVDNCMLQSKEANNIIKEINRILTKNKIKPYDEKTGEGIIRHIYIRYGFNSKEIMVTLITNGEVFPGRNNVITDLKKANLGITTIVQNINSRKTSIVLGDKEKVLYGPGFIYEYVSDYKFKISSKSFFQVNTLGMEKLYNLAMEKANIKKNDIVLDAYCGVGTISIFASKYAKKVIGVELNKDAIKDAKINAQINNISNITFIADDSTNFITHLAKDREKIDVVIMDPPREGSTKAFINAINYLGVKKVVYVSCDPTTLKRDLYTFFDNDYILKSITAVDMFSRTQHVECVAVLELDDEIEMLEKLVKENKKNNTNKYKENKLKYIPKADVEMLREDRYEASGKIHKKNKKY